MNIVIGGPIRNRGWILQRHLDALKAMRVPEGVEVQFLYFVNDSTDDTAEILTRNGVSVVQESPGHPSGHVRGLYDYGNLADLRNRFMGLVFKLFPDVTHVLSIDSDVIVPPHALEYLLADDKDIVSMLLCNQPLPIEAQRAHNVMNDTEAGIMMHIHDFPMDELFPCDLTGACYLIKRAVVEAGCLYRHDIQGEDIPFCRDAKRKGFGIFCDSRVRPIHVMYEGYDVEAGRITSESRDPLEQAPA